jgi:ketosteroid isomerase-like protein
MKIRLVALLGLAMSFALPSFAQQTTADPQLREQLLTLAKKFEDAWNNNDAVALSTLFTEDAVLIEDSGPGLRSGGDREALQRHVSECALQQQSH